jgi:hypothetical protein
MHLDQTAAARRGSVCVCACVCVRACVSVSVCVWLVIGPSGRVSSQPHLTGIGPRRPPHPVVRRRYRTDLVHGSGDAQGLLFCEGVAQAFAEEGLTPFHGRMVKGGANWVKTW